MNPRKDVSTEADRVLLSRLVLVAAVKDDALSLGEIREFLMGTLSSSSPRFFFDLGWRETLRTTFGALSALSWVSEHESGQTYRATPLGLHQLHQRWNEVAPLIGISQSGDVAQN